MRNRRFESRSAVPSKHTTASSQRRCNVTTLQPRCNDVVRTLCVCWVSSALLQGISSILKEALEKVFFFFFFFFTR